MFHYQCPTCKRHFCSQIYKKWTCSWCSSNDKLKLLLRRKKEKQYTDEVDLGSMLSKRIAKRKKEGGRSKKVVDYKAFFENDDDDDDFLQKEIDKDLDDDTWEPPARTFNIGMRLTTGLFRMRCRAFDASQFDQALRKTKYQAVGGVAGRAPCCTVMGAAIHQKGTISAANYAKMVKKWPAPTASHVPKDAKQRPEWCHLIADSLGGPTSPDNLVAASYGANTHMAVIETLLKGHTALNLRVTAHCSAEHFAEFIEYRIEHKDDPLHFLIDGRNDWFTKDDMNDVQGRVIDWMKRHKLKVATL